MVIVWFLLISLIGVTADNPCLSQDKSTCLVLSSSSCAWCNTLQQCNFYNPCNNLMISNSQYYNCSEIVTGPNQPDCNQVKMAGSIFLAIISLITLIIGFISNVSCWYECKSLSGKISTAIILIYLSAGLIVFAIGIVYLILGNYNLANWMFGGFILVGTLMVGFLAFLLILGFILVSLIACGISFGKTIFDWLDYDWKWLRRVRYWIAHLAIKMAICCRQPLPDLSLDEDETL